MDNYNYKHKYEKYLMLNGSGLTNLLKMAVAKSGTIAKTVAAKSDTIAKTVAAKSGTIAKTVAAKKNSLGNIAEKAKQMAEKAKQIATKAKEQAKIKGKKAFDAIRKNIPNIIACLEVANVPPNENINTTIEILQRSVDDPDKKISDLVTVEDIEFIVKTLNDVKHKKSVNNKYKNQIEITISALNSIIPIYPLLQFI